MTASHTCIKTFSSRDSIIPEYLGMLMVGHVGFAAIAWMSLAAVAPGQALAATVASMWTISRLTRMPRAGVLVLLADTIGTTVALALHHLALPSAVPEWLAQGPFSWRSYAILLGLLTGADGAILWRNACSAMRPKPLRCEKHHRDSVTSGDSTSVERSVHGDLHSR